MHPDDRSRRRTAHDRSHQALSQLCRVADELNGAAAATEVCEIVLAAAMGLPGFEAGWIHLVDGEGAESGRPAAAIDPGSAAPPPAPAISRSSAALAARLLSIDIALERQRLGVMRLLVAKGEHVDEEERKVLQAIARQAAAALDRARLHQRLDCVVEERTAALQAEVAERRRAEEKVVGLNRIHAVLSGINSLIVRVHERDELFRESCRIAVELGSFGLAWVGLVEEDGRRVVPTAWHGTECWNPLQDFAMQEYFATEGRIVGEALRQRRAVTCRDPEDTSGVPFGRHAAAFGFHACAVLPLLEGGRPVALLFLYASRPDVFDDQELRLLEEMAEDISFALDHLAREERIKYLAYYDPLTGLANRDLLLDRLHHAVALAQRHDRMGAVFCLDLDHFKIVNDGLGAHLGDQLLRKVGQALVGVLREIDTVARVGADKFVLVCTELARGEDVTAIVGKLQAALRGPIPLDGESAHLTASIGVAFYPRDSDDPATLVKYAELAMYQAKDQGGNRHAVFTRELETRVSERLGLQNRLREAIEGGELVIHYQPQISALTGAVSGMEALVRWQHPDFGLLLPARFISLAEESGLIVPLGNWVLREACRQNRAWHDEGIADFPVAVNLSVTQLQDADIVGEVRRVLDETGLEPHFLELELTESQLMQNAEALVGSLANIRKMGVKIAIDDFGSGYSSLNYLKRLPADRLKVDYSFVRDITNDPASASICRAIVAIAHNLRMGVVAEGVETDAQAAYLARHHCDGLQGYLICRPAPAEEVTALLRRREPLLSVSWDQGARRTLLLVDDDASVRSALRRALRGDGYQILEAAGHAEAFDLLAKHPVGVILCDQRMPGMTGTELLRRIKDIYPDAMRIVLSGYVDLETVTASVNQGAVFKFLLKPWENEALREVLRDAFWHYELSQRMAADWFTAGEIGERRHGP